MRINEALYGLLDLIDQIVHKDSIIIEIGTYTGESTVLFSRKAKKVFTIDPYIQNYDPNDGAGETDLQQVKAIFFERLRNSNSTDKVYQYQELSKTAKTHFKDKSVDIVYIDGLHTYEGVKEDIKNYLPKIKSGGYIAGHDYCDKFSGVIKAVNEAFGKPDQLFLDSSWIVKVK